MAEGIVPSYSNFVDNDSEITPQSIADRLSATDFKKIWNEYNAFRKAHKRASMATLAFVFPNNLSSPLTQSYYTLGISHGFSKSQMLNALINRNKREGMSCVVMKRGGIVSMKSPKMKTPPKPKPKAAARGRRRLAC
jgi:hypothetical protein